MFLLNDTDFLDSSHPFSSCCPLNPHWAPIWFTVRADIGAVRLYISTLARLESIYNYKEKYNMSLKIHLILGMNALLQSKLMYFKPCQPPQAGTYQTVRGTAVSAPLLGKMMQLERNCELEWTRGLQIILIRIKWKEISVWNLQMHRTSLYM